MSPSSSSSLSTTSRPHPHLDVHNIPTGARPPAVPSASQQWPPYAFELAEQPSPRSSYSYAPTNPTYAFPQPQLLSPDDAYTPHAHAHAHASFPYPPDASRLGPPAVPPRPRAVSAYEPDAALFAFPEPLLHRSVSQRAPTPPPKPHSGPRPTHRSSKSDAAAFASPSPYASESVTSFSAYGTPESQTHDLPDDLASLSLDSEEGLRRFQAGQVPEQDEQWHRFVPPEAIDALGKHEVERQSVIWEVFTSERDYVSDLELIRDVFIEPLRNAQPEVIPQSRLRGFIAEVFWNIDKIRAHHQRMLASLFNRQREQHPLVSSVADIVLDNALLFMSDYESYIKHSPLSLSRHRTELARNPAYAAFLATQTARADPRLRRRDLKTLLSRPVTRLPRLKLLLERVHSRTDPEHPDAETLPLLLTVLGDLVKSAEPGIAVAEGKVGFWDVCESLVYSRGEIIDMDLYDDSRTLIYSGPLARKSRSDNWHSWSELLVALLDNYLLLLREETRPNGAVKRLVISRPIPLDYLRLGSFTDPPDTRRERSADDASPGGRGLGLLHSLTGGGAAREEVFPFTLYHAGAKSARRYTLWAPSAAARRRWHDALVDALGVRRARQEANMWFAPQVLNDGFFRVGSLRAIQGPDAGTKLTGRVACAALFSSAGKHFLAVGCADGIYVAVRGQDSFTRVLSLASPTALIALQEFNKLLVHHEATLLSYSLDLLARVALAQAPARSLAASLEHVTPPDTSVAFCRAGRFGERTLVVYAAKGFLQMTLHALEVVHIAETGAVPRRSQTGPLGFRSFGSPFNAPRDTHDATFLAKSVAVCAGSSILILKPTDFASAPATVVPDFAQASLNTPMASLKARCEGARVLGIVRQDTSELLVVYDDMGCYVDKYGTPSRSSGYVRWETKAAAYAQRGAHLLLFSPAFVEVRQVATGRLVQVIEGQDVRLLHAGLAEKDALLVGWTGEQAGQAGASERIVELVQTAEIAPATPSSAVQGVWDEWDM